MYIQIVYNFCYAAALLGLIHFWAGTRDLLKPYRPVWKFLTVKGVVFITFWQGLVLSLLFINQSEEKAKQLQTWLLCLEMLPAAVAMWFAFPAAPYMNAARNREQGGIMMAVQNVGNVVMFTDVVTDLKHQARARRPRSAWSHELHIGDGTARAARSGRLAFALSPCGLPQRTHMPRVPADCSSARTAAVLVVAHDTPSCRSAVRAAVQHVHMLQGRRRRRHRGARAVGAVPPRHVRHPRPLSRTGDCAVAIAGALACTCSVKRRARLQPSFVQGVHAEILSRCAEVST